MGAPDHVTSTRRVLDPRERLIAVAAGTLAESREISAMISEARLVHAAALAARLGRDAAGWEEALAGDASAVADAEAELEHALAELEREPADEGEATVRAAIEVLAMRLARLLVLAACAESGVDEVLAADLDADRARWLEVALSYRSRDDDLGSDAA